MSTHFVMYGMHPLLDNNGRRFNCVCLRRSSNDKVNHTENSPFHMFPALSRSQNGLVSNFHP